MKIAIVHDALYEYGGSERVLESILELYPNATLYTFFYKKNKILDKRFGKYKVNHSQLISFLVTFLPTKYVSILKIVAPIYFILLRLDSYKLILSSSHSFGSKLANLRGKTTHITYIHGLPKYLYGYKNEMSFLRIFPFNILFYPVMLTLKWIDMIGSRNPDVYLTNSKFSQKQLQNHYQITARILYPPVKEGTIKNKKSMFYLVHSRLVKQKGIDLILKSFNKTGLPLVVVGDGYLKATLEKHANKNIKFVGWLSENELEGIRSYAKALVVSAVEEDFGLTTAEALFSKTPVIGYRSGGTIEQVTNNNGLLFDEYTVESLTNSILTFEEMSESFDIKPISNTDAIFKEKLLTIVSKAIC